MTERTLVLGTLAVCLGAAAAFAGDPPAPPPRGPVRIFVRGRADEAKPPDAEMEARKERATTLRKAFEDKRKELRKANGKDMRKWPADARTAYFAARDESGFAWSANWYVARPATEKSDSVEDLKEKLAKERKAAWTTLASSAEDADLVVEVVGRKGMMKFMSGPKWMAYDVLPGRVAAATLVALPRDTIDEAPGTWILHWPTSAEPFLRLEAGHNERWTDTAGVARDALEQFAQENYAALKP